MLNILKDKGYTLSCIESYTGGSFASEVVKTPGASKYFVGGLVTYATEIKNKFGVDTSNGVISKECAISMVNVCQQTFTSDVAVSFTGNAGPDVMDGKAVGLCYIAIKIKDKVYDYELNLKGNRLKNINDSIEFVYKKINELLK